MLNEKVFIFGVQVDVGGLFTANTYFLDSTKAQYVQVDDVLTNFGNEFRIVAIDGPATDGVIITYEPILQGSILQDNGDYDSSISTPGTYEVRTVLTVVGSISSIVFDPATYSWYFTALWDDPSVANNAQIGDLVVDSSGRVFELVFLDESNKWAIEARIKELDTERYGIAPLEGQANLFRPTQGEGLFTGTVFNQQVETAMWTRDNWIIEKWIGDEVNSGNIVYRDRVEIQPADVSSKQFKLTYVPINPESLMLVPIGGPIQVHGDDYEVNGDTVSWNGMGLDGLVETGDEFLCFYQTNSFNP